MTRYDIDRGIPTLAPARSEHMNADELKALAMLTRTSTPTRKARGSHLQVPQGRSAARHVAGFRGSPEGGRRGKLGQ